MIDFHNVLILILFIAKSTLFEYRHMQLASALTILLINRNYYINLEGKQIKNITLTYQYNVGRIDEAMLMQDVGHLAFRSMHLPWCRELLSSDKPG